jgi:hypothetical protein
MTHMVKIYGAKAKVFLSCERDIRELSQILSKGLVIPDFVVDFREEHPFDLTASCEVLGCELWLNSIPAINNYNFLLELETELSYDEIGLNQMYDLSPWLARFIANICDIKSAIYDDNQVITEFSISNNKTSH